MSRSSSGDPGFLATFGPVPPDWAFCLSLSYCQGLAAEVYPTSPPYSEFGSPIPSERRRLLGYALEVGAFNCAGTSSRALARSGDRAFFVGASPQHAYHQRNIRQSDQAPAEGEAVMHRRPISRTSEATIRPPWGGKSDSRSPHL